MDRKIISARLRRAKVHCAGMYAPLELLVDEGLEAVLAQGLQVLVLEVIIVEHCHRPAHSITENRRS